MSFNELNAVEHFIIQKLSGKNLNAADPMSSMLEDDKAVWRVCRASDGRRRGEPVRPDQLVPHDAGGRLGGGVAGRMRGLG